MVETVELLNKFPCICFDNIKLRGINQGDYNELFEIYSDYDNAKFMTPKIHKTVEETKWLIDWILEEYKNGRCIYWSITFSDKDKLIGFVAIHNIDYENKSARVAYVLNKNYWKQGIASKAVKIITELTFRETSIKMIEATIKPNNVSSKKCIESAGYMFEKKVSDYVSKAKNDDTKERLFYVKKA